MQKVLINTCKICTLQNLTEGRGYYGKAIVSAPKYSGVNTVYQYLFK